MFKHIARFSPAVLTTAPLAYALLCGTVLSCAVPAARAAAPAPLESPDGMVVTAQHLALPPSCAAAAMPWTQLLPWVTRLR
jgi:hypothetical protein